MYCENKYVENIFVDFLPQQFPTVRVRLTFQVNPYFLLKYLKKEFPFSLILKLSNK